MIIESDLFFFNSDNATNAAKKTQASSGNILQPVAQFKNILQRNIFCLIITYGYYHFHKQRMTIKKPNDSCFLNFNQFFRTLDCMFNDGRKSSMNYSTRLGKAYYSSITILRFLTATLRLKCM